MCHVNLVRTWHITHFFHFILQNRTNTILIYRRHIKRHLNNLLKIFCPTLALHIIQRMSNNVLVVGQQIDRMRETCDRVYQLKNQTYLIIW